MVSWLRNSLDRERTLWCQGAGIGPGPAPAGSDALAAALVPLLGHREAETREGAAQAVAAALLASEAQGGSGAGPQVLLPMSRTNPKVRASLRATEIEKGAKE